MKIKKLKLFLTIGMLVSFFSVSKVGAGIIRTRHASKECQDAYNKSGEQITIIRERIRILQEKIIFIESKRRSQLRICMLKERRGTAPKEDSSDVVKDENAEEPSFSDGYTY